MRKHLRKRGAAATLVVLGWLLASLLSPTYAATPRSDSAQPPGDPAALVNPFVGTGSGPGQIGPIDTFPGADVPFGMLQWSPETTPNRPFGGGYAYGDGTTIGFSLTHLSGPGCPVFGDVPIMPVPGVPTSPGQATATIRPGSEVAAPGSYSATLEPGTQVSLAVTQRTGIARFAFPSGPSASVLFKVAASQFPSQAAAVTSIGDRTVIGSVGDGAFCLSPSHYTVYFAAEFSRPFSGSGQWVTNGMVPTSLTVPGQAPGDRGEFVTFDTSGSRTVSLKVGVSFTSVAEAEKNLQTEDPGWDLGAVASRAHQAWDDQLDRIGVAGGTPRQQSVFYTALYHSLLHPNVFSDADGSYIGFDGLVHNAGRRVQYANFSGWDIYRTQFPLISLLDPGVTSDMVSSLLADAEQGGWLPKWPVAASYTSTQDGDSADVLIAEADTFGAKNFDAAAALAAMVKGATSSGAGQGWYVERKDLLSYETLGYVPTLMGNPQGGGVPVTETYWGSSQTLEYSNDDFAISRFAAAHGSVAVASEFQNRAANWQKVFDPSFGTMAARSPDGSFPAGPDTYEPYPTYGQPGFEEGSGSQYTWMVPFDLGQLADAFGGTRAAIAALDTHVASLESGPQSDQLWVGNEVGLGTPWEFDAFGEPWRTAQLVHQIATTYYTDTPAGEPGNDDLGTMSAWYVWAALGMYPLDPAAGTVVLTAPMFDSATLHVGGRTLRIAAPGASEGQRYVSSLAIDGADHAAPWVPAATLQEGGTWVYSLSGSAASAWGTDGSLAPPSYTIGAAPALGFTTPSGQISVPVGKATPIDLSVRSLDTAVGGVSWSSFTDAGVAVTPANGRLQLSTAPGSTVSVPVYVRELVPGPHRLTFTFTTESGTRLPSVVVDVEVQP
ncbi:MAG TPA: GH92 family glycosyl hydrolase [Acidimicrobiales bacterium]